MPNVAEMRQKAEAGSCVNQCMLGLCYLYGDGVELDYQEAFRWLSAAAAQGASRAVLNLGYMYAEGLGIPQDVREAVRLFTAVASPSDSSDAFAARIELARIFLKGRGIPPDGDEALKWYSAAIALATDDEDSEELREAKAYVTIGRKKD
jgi:TPR repeat protein